MEIIIMNDRITPYATICDPLEVGGCSFNCKLNYCYVNGYVFASDNLISNFCTPI